MTSADTPRETAEIWEALQSEGAAMRRRDTLDLFADDPARVGSFALSAAGLFVDYSKNRLSRRARDLLLELAHAQALPKKIHAMFAGDPINRSEDRAVLHTALRDLSGAAVHVQGENVQTAIAQERERMLTFVDEVHAGHRLGASGKALSTVVNIGIGGSDLGPQMAVEALRPYWVQGRRCFFVSNVDGQHLADTLEDLNWETTLFVVASKTFTTQETMTNARSALRWFRAQASDAADVARHFVALSTNAAAVAEFGIPASSTFGFWDWVGGRYSLWSSIGMSIALQTGRACFLALLGGAQEMDAHFRRAPLDENLPVLLALTGIWNRNVEGMGAHAILPYDQHLHRLPAYLQQADMESNGKSVSQTGEALARSSGPVIFGEPGTNGQHAFFQLMHQGTDPVSADFIAAAQSQTESGDHHPKLLANFLAQPRALMIGKTAAQAREELLAAGLDEKSATALTPHKVFPGNRPSTLILMDRLTPERLGALLALYEHKIFCQGVVWGVNSFDQWGVELGKQLAGEILPLLSTPQLGADAATQLDPSTAQMLRAIRAQRDL